MEKIFVPFIEPLRIDKITNSKVLSWSADRSDLLVVILFVLTLVFLTEEDDDAENDDLDNES